MPERSFQSSFVIDKPVLCGTHVRFNIKTTDDQLLVCIVQDSKLMSTLHVLQVAQMSVLDITGTLLHDIKGLDRPTVVVTGIKKGRIPLSSAVKNPESSDNKSEEYESDDDDDDDECCLDNNDREKNNKRTYDDRRSPSLPAADTESEMEDDTVDQEKEEERIKEAEHRESKRHRADAMEISEDDAPEMVPSANLNNCPGNLFYNLYGRLEVLQKHGPHHLQPQVAMLYELLEFMASTEQGISSNARLFVEKMSEFHTRLKDCYRECPNVPYPLDTNEVELPHWIYESLPKKKRSQQR